MRVRRDRVERTGYIRVVIKKDKNKKAETGSEKKAK